MMEVPYVKLIVGVVVAVAIAYSGYSLYSWGYSKADAKWSVKYADLEATYSKLETAEINRQVKANEEAKKKEAERLAALQRENDELEATVGRLKHEASEDPDAGGVGITRAGSLRLNKVR